MDRCEPNWKWTDPEESMGIKRILFTCVIII